MIGDQPVSWLMFFTLASAIIVGAVAFLAFLRSARNREIADAALVQGGSTRAAPQGALPELAGLVAIALVAMSLLTAGYMNNPAESRTSATSAKAK